MATIKQGILGPFSGKVGTVIGAVWRGIAVIRGIATSHTNPNTPGQLDQRAKFKLIVQFLRTVLSVVRIGFAKYSAGTTAFATAVKENLAVGIKGISPAFEIDYTKVTLGKGNLEGALNPVAQSMEAGKIDFTWDDNSGVGSALATDHAYMIAVCPLLGKSVSELAGTQRSLGTDTLTVPDMFIGQQVHAYLMFTNGTDIADSQFVDTVVVA